MPTTIHLSSGSYTMAPEESRGFLTYCGKRIIKEDDNESVMNFTGVYSILNKEIYSLFKKQNPNHELCKTCLLTTANVISKFLTENL